MVQQHTFAQKGDAMIASAIVVLAQLTRQTYDTIPAPEVFAKAVTALVTTLPAESRAFVDIESFKAMSRRAADSSRNWDRIIETGNSGRTIVSRSGECHACYGISAHSVRQADSVLTIGLTLSWPPSSTGFLSITRYEVDLVRRGENLVSRDVRAGMRGSGIVRKGGG